MNGSHTILAAVLALSTSFHAAASELVLVERGQPRAVIVLPARTGPRSVEAGSARILSDHLRLMSGARLEIRREDELGPPNADGGRLAFPQQGDKDAFILVGESEVAGRLDLTSEGLGPGGILVKTRGNVLALFGPEAESDGAGTRHAVVEFLETLGVRYLWPGETGRVLPKSDTITAGPLDVRFTPPIGQRRIRVAGMRERSLSGLARLQLARDEWDEAAGQARAMEADAGWTAWQRLGGNIGIGGGHAGAGLRGGWDEHGEHHPEWFALQADGTRDQGGTGDRWRLCKSNPELIEFVAAGIIERLDENPNLTCVSLSPNDGGYSSHCRCEGCKPLDPPEAPKVRFLVFEQVGKSRRHEIQYPALTDRMVWYWNQVAERVTEVHPHVLFLAEAYSLWSTPPVRERLHPNLVVRYVPSGTEGWEGWQRAGAKRIYWRPNILLAGRRDGMLHVMADQLAETMQFMADRGMLATDFDSILHHWSIHGLNYIALRDVALHHNLAVNAANLLWATADFARWSPIGGRGYRPPSARLEQVAEGGFRLTGREAGLDEMRTALGLDRPLPEGEADAPTPRAPDGAPRTVVEADEEGRPMEMPAGPET